MFGVVIGRQMAASVGSATNERTVALVWSAISQAALELEPRYIPTSAGPIPQKAGMGIAIPQKESIHLLHKNSKWMEWQAFRNWNWLSTSFEYVSSTRSMLYMGHLKRDN